MWPYLGKSKPNATILTCLEIFVLLCMTTPITIPVCFSSLSIKYKPGTVWSLIFFEKKNLSWVTVLFIVVAKLIRILLLEWLVHAELTWHVSPGMIHSARSSSDGKKDNIEGRLWIGYACCPSKEGKGREYVRKTELSWYLVGRRI